MNKTRHHTKGKLFQSLKAFLTTYKLRNSKIYTYQIPLTAVHPLQYKRNRTLLLRIRIIAIKENIKHLANNTNYYKIKNKGYRRRSKTPKAFEKLRSAYRNNKN
jgi:hypothetical protein